MKAIVKWLEKVCEKNELDILTIDYKAMYDSKLTFGENKELFLEHLKPILKEKEIKKVEAVEQIKDEGDRVIKEWKEQNPKFVVHSNKKERIRDYLRMINGGYMNSFVIHSNTGLGKTFMVINISKEENIKFEYRSGYTTPLSLYKYLYENRNSLIVFDDLEGLFSNEIAVAILKSALWEADGKRIVSYDTTSKKIDLIPEHFEFTGKLVILTNKFGGKNDENFNALKSRITSYELTFTYDEILKITNEIIDSRGLDPNQVKKVKELVKKHVNEASDFNLRVLDRLIGFVKYDFDKSEELFLDSFEIDEEMELVLKLMNSNLSLDEQVKRYQIQTGFKRRTYYTRRKKLENRQIGKNIV